MSQPPNQPYPGYPEHGGQSYPGYSQPSGQSYPGYSQPQEQPHHGYSQHQEQSYSGYPQSPDPSYPGQGQQQGQPYPGHGQQQGQPYPGYGQSQEPSYPGYAQPHEQSYPGYQQGGEQSYPGYGQPQESSYPGYSQYQDRPTSGYPAGAGTPVPPPKKSNVGKVVLIVVVALLLLCGGGTAVAFFALKDDVKEAAQATQTHVVAPETLAGRPKITEPELQKVADQMVTDMKSEVQNAKETVGAFYGDVAKEDMVMIAAASGLVADPAKELEEGLRGLNTELKLTKVTAIEPGPLGGVAKCGDATAEGIRMGVCIWADKGSVGVIAIYFKTAAQAKAEFVKIRGEVETRS